ncbi:MAG: tryptophan synthase subunit alpha [Pontibacterium sp.]
MHPLDTYIRQTREDKPILIMAHVVYGYPTVEASTELMREVLRSGVELLEIQFPFSDPVADGEVITHACHHALKQKPKFAQYLALLSELADEFPKQQILMMGYLNPVIQYGVEQCAQQLAGKVHAAIVPDLTIEQSALLAPLGKAGIAPIWIATPDTSDARLKAIGEHAQGFVYCMSQAGVTGQTGNLSDHLAPYIHRVQEHIKVPVGVGFGISEKADVDAITGLADIAIIGSALLRAYNQSGVEAVSALIKSLR